MTDDTQPLVSVCLPVCNGGAHVGEAISSVLAQEYRNFELIVSDDDSDDDTLKIVERLSDHRTVIHHNTDRRGIPGNWNTCLDLASGKYVCIFHQDDVMHPQNVARKVQLLESDDTIAWVHSAVTPLIEDAPHHFSEDWLESSTDDFVVDGLDYFCRLVCSGNCVCAPTVMARHRWVAEERGFSPLYHFAPDYELWLRLSLHGRVGFISHALMTYRWHRNNATHRARTLESEAEIRTAASVALDFLDSQHPPPHLMPLLRSVTQITAAQRRWLTELQLVRTDQEQQLARQFAEMADLRARVRNGEARLSAVRRRFEHVEAADARTRKQNRRLRRRLRSRRRSPDPRTAPSQPDRWPLAPRHRDSGAHHRVEPLRLLFVIQALPPESVGGSELQVAQLAKTFGPRHQVTVIADREGGPAHDAHPLESSGVSVRWFNSPDRKRPDLRGSYDRPEIDERFEVALDAVQPHIVHVHGLWGLSNRLPLVAQRRGIPVVFTLHDFWLMCPRGQRLRPTDLSLCHEIDNARCAACLQPWLSPPTLPSLPAVIHHVKKASSATSLWHRARARLRRHRRRDSRHETARYHDLTTQLVRTIDMFVSPSDFLRDEFIRYGIPASKVARIDNGIDTAGMRRAKSPSTAVRFGYVGSLMPSKGVHLLLDAFTRLGSRHCQCLVFGRIPTGDSGRYARSLARFERDPRVRMMGDFDPSEVSRIFSSIDVLVVPSLWFENAPLTILEAFASLTPVIGPRHGGFLERIKPGRNGLFFEPGNVEDLTTQLRRTLDDQALLRQLREGIEPVRDLSDTAAELEALYYHLVEGKLERTNRLSAE